MTSTILTRLRDLRESYAQRRALWRELGAYTTANDLNDLEAVIARYDDAETEDIRHILAAHRAIAARRG